MAVQALTADSPDLPTWKNLANGDTGAAMTLAPYRSCYFVVTGTPGAGLSVQLEGSNDGANWYKLTPAALVAVGPFAALGVNEYPKYIRPNVTAGDGTTDITITGHAFPNQ